MTKIRVPRQVFIDLTTACNATCIMCPTQIYEGRKKLISNTLFEKIICEVASFDPPVECFYFGVHGEPLVDKTLEEKVQRCTELGITRTLVATNGSLMTERRARALLEAKPWTVVFSLESMKADVYEKIRAGLSHAQIIENIKRFIALRNELDSPTRIALRFIVSGWNRNEKDSFLNYWTPMLDISGREDYIETDPIHNWALGNPDDFHGVSPCPHIDLMTILSDGVVSACCLDYQAVHNFGSIEDNSLVEIFSGPAATHFRDMHIARRRNELDMCKTCNVGEFWATRDLLPIAHKDTFIAASHI